MAAGDVLVLIPARLASMRLPGKPLADLCGKPMIVHVLERATAAAVGPVVVATDSAEIIAAVSKAGGRAVMTRGAHESGSDPVHETADPLEPREKFEQLRALEAGMRIDVPIVDRAPPEVTTAEDLELVRSVMRRSDRQTR